MRHLNPLERAGIDPHTVEFQHSSDGTNWTHYSESDPTYYAEARYFVRMARDYPKNFRIVSKATGEPIK